MPDFMSFWRIKIACYFAAILIAAQSSSRAQSSQSSTGGPFSVSQATTGVAPGPSSALQFAAEEQQAQTAAIASSLQLKPTNRQPNIPADASPTLQAFLTTQTALANARAQIHNQLVQSATASGGSVTFAQLAQLEQQEEQLFRHQNAVALTLQQQRSRVVADESPQSVQPVPDLVIIPANTSPQMAAYLTIQNQLRRGIVQVRNQYVNSTPAVREAALQAWREQNASQFEQLQQAAQTLAQTNTTTQN